MSTTTGFTREQVDAILLRDGGKCCLCGRNADTANHRMNRGAGGRPSLNRIDNGCAICWRCNDLIERDAVARADAIHLGVKLPEGASFQTPLWSPFFGMWLVLWITHTDLTGNRDKTTRPETPHADHLL